MYCAITKGECNKTCVLYNLGETVAENQCNLKKGLSFYLFLTDMMLASIGIPRVQNQVPENPTCIISKETCKGKECSLYDNDCPPCGLLTGVLNYIAQSDTLIKQINAEDQLSQQTETPAQTQTQPPSTPPATPPVTPIEPAKTTEPQNNATQPGQPVAQ